MRKLALGILFAALALGFAQPAAAQNETRICTPIYSSTGAMSCLDVGQAAGNAGAAHAFPVEGIAGGVAVPVTGTFSATLGGFAPTPAYATLTATASSASVALPTGTVVLFFNNGTAAVSCTLGIGSATASAGQNVIQPQSWLALTVGSNTFGACIDQTGSASNVVALSGGAGLATGAGGGGGSGGGGGAVTAASGAYASGSLSSGAGADGWDVTEGAKTDAKNTATDTTAVSVVSILKEISSLEQAPVSRAVTNAGTFATQITQWAAGTLGAMANYGTSPGAVLVPGVNAFVTNSNANGQATTANSSPVVQSTTATASAAIAISTATTTQLVALSGSTKIYVDSLSVVAAGTGNIQFEYGTGTNCATGTTVLTGNYNLTAQTGLAMGAGIGPVLVVPAGNALCALTSAGVGMAGAVSYAQF